MLLYYSILTASSTRSESKYVLRRIIGLIILSEYSLTGWKIIYFGWFVALSSYNPVYMWKSNWVVIYSLTCGISHAAKSSKLTCHIRPSATGVENCKKCILQQAGATDILREPEENAATLKFLVTGSLFFYMNVETFCSGTRLCGQMKLEESADFQLKQPIASTNIEARENAEYICVMKSKDSHTITCKTCFKEKTKSQIVGNFMMHDSSSRQSQYVYLFYRSKSPIEIVNSCFSSRLCKGYTFLLSSKLCNRFQSKLPLSDRASSLPPV